MSMNETPKGERLHIGLFGRRNAGKSSILNALTGQNLAIVSDIAGTTTDPVQKAMELLPLGPVVFIDTPGLDDEGELGNKRIEKSYQALAKTDLALLIIDSTTGKTSEDELIEQKIKEKNIPYLCIYNKCDLMPDVSETSTISETDTATSNTIHVSTTTKENIHSLKDRIAAMGTELLQEKEVPIVKDLVTEGDVVILVVPIDKAAPKGRLILPQQQTIRELLDAGAHTMVVRDCELADTFLKLSCKPKLVITDSQAFEKVDQIVPKDVLLTSFSILMARHKGNFKDALKGVTALSNITDDSHILICEGCSHHRQCGDIGTEKMPAWIRNFTKASPRFSWTSGTEFPSDLSAYDMIIHCGGCMLNEREMCHRYNCASMVNVPMTNYGLAISYMHGILERSTEVLKNLS